MQLPRDFDGVLKHLAAISDCKFLNKKSFSTLVFVVDKDVGMITIYKQYISYQRTWAELKPGNMMKIPFHFVRVHYLD